MARVLDQVRGILHPDGYHDLGPGSFEGWYVKMVTADLGQRWAVIPGIFRGTSGDDEAFVQVLDGSSGRSWYHVYDASTFRADPLDFDVQVGPNHFTTRAFALDLPQLRGTLEVVGSFDPWPVTPLAPGAMGWYAWVPAMECYHGVCSFGHGLRGTLEVEGQPVDFTAGRGYVEKDWGEAFPAGYLWIHTNTFEHSEASLMGSVALIPWRGREFRGFIIGLRVAGKLYKFATYTGARSRSLRVDDSHVTWVVQSRTLPTRPPLELSIRAERQGGGLLHAPVRTQMHQRVEETLNSTIEVRLSRGGEVLFEDVGRAGALEVHGETTRLLATTEKR